MRLPVVRSSWVPFLKQKIAQYQPKYWAVGKADPRRVHHIFSIGVFGGDRVFAFESEGDLNTFLAKYPACEKCMEPT